MYCSKCDTNWAKLYKHDDEANDESYEYCPLCGTDSFLSDTKQGETYILSLSGAVINSKTGKAKFTASQKIKSNPIKNIPSWLENEKERERREDLAIESYQQAIKSGMDEEEAKDIYHALMKKRKKIK